MSIRNQAGFTAAELLVASAIIIVVCAAVVMVTSGVSLNIKLLEKLAGIANEGRTDVEVISRDIRQASHVLTSYGSYTTADDVLLLQVASINASGDVIDSKTLFDVIVYTKDVSHPHTLQRVVYADASSYRTSGSAIYPGNIKTLYFSWNGTGLGSVADKSYIDIVTIQLVTSGTVLGIETTSELVTRAALRNR